MECKDTTLLSLIGQAVYSCKVCDVPILKQGKRGRSPRYCGQHNSMRRGENPIKIRLRMKHCLRCQQKLNPAQVRVCKKYCSRGCRLIAQRKAPTCRYCQRMFVPKYPQWVTYCTRECAFEHKRIKAKEAAATRICTTKPVEHRTCKECKTVFPLQRINQVHCSVECKRSHNSRVMRNHMARKREPGITRRDECIVCKAFIAPERRHGHRVYCSDKCLTKAYLRSERGKQRAKESKVRRQRREQEAKVETVNSYRVFERDNWLCWICKRPTNRMVSFPHPDYPTVDHVVPLNKGGEHSYANCKCSHSLCNSVKRDLLINNQI